MAYPQYTPYQPTWANPYLMAQAYGAGYTAVPQAQQPTNGIVKVNGRDSALQYQLPPNNISDQGGRIDSNEMGKLADIVKDLAMAEKECWEASYYEAVTEAMDAQGYTPEGMVYDGMVYDGQRGYQNGRQGYRGRDSMGRFTSRRGYADQDAMRRANM